MRKLSRIISVCALLLTGISATPSPSAAASPDPVVEWIKIMNDTALGGGPPPFFTSRIVAMVSASVFDAVNGIDPRYRPIHVRPTAPDGASPRAAAIEAAYVILVDAYQMKGPTLTTQVKASLAALALTESAQSISDGAAWGQTVANAIWAWRQADGFAPPPAPFEGVLAIAGTPAATGSWLPNSPLPAPGAGTQ